MRILKVNCLKAGIKSNLSIVNDFKIFALVLIVIAFAASGQSLNNNDVYYNYLPSALF